MIYDNIKKIAATKGISIYQIEKDLEFSNGLISKWNESTPYYTNLIKVADYLNVKISELISDEKEEK